MCLGSLILEFDEFGRFLLENNYASFLFFDLSEILNNYASFLFFCFPSCPSQQATRTVVKQFRTGLTKCLNCDTKFTLYNGLTSKLLKHKKNFVTILLYFKI